MDSITHGIIGAVTAQMGFRQKLGKQATWLAVLGGVLADIDILAYPLINQGAENAQFTRMMAHRGLSHSLLMAPVITMAISGGWWWFRKRSGRPVSFWWLIGGVGLAALCHPILDWCTSYGTQLFAPITHQRYAINAIAIVDIFFSLGLIFFLLAGFLIRKFCQNVPKKTIVAGWLGFMFAAGYIGTSYGLGRMAIEQVKGQMGPADTDGQSAKKAQYKAYPQMGSIFRWRVTRYDGWSWQAAGVNILAGGGKEKIEINRAELLDNEWVGRASQREEFRKYQWFAMGQGRAVYRREGGEHVVEFHDMRYGTGPGSLECMWPLRVKMNDKGEVAQVEWQRHFDKQGRGRMLQQLWRLWRGKEEVRK